MNAMNYELRRNVDYFDRNMGDIERDYGRNVYVAVQNQRIVGHMSGLWLQNRNWFNEFEADTYIKSVAERELTLAEIALYDLPHTD